MASPASASATPALSASDAADVAVLEDALFRLASTEDAKMEASVARVLPKLLPLFLRPSQQVREALMRICNHVLKRIQALPTLKLPVKELLALYREHTSPDAVAAAGGSGGGVGFFVTFVLLFVEKGLPRLSAAERAQLAHELLPGLAQRAPAQQKTLLHAFFRCLAPADYQVHHVPPEDLRKRWEPLAQSTADQEVLLAFMLDALVWAPVFVQPPPKGAAAAPAAAGAAAPAGGDPSKPAEPVVPDGLSPASLAVLTLDHTLPSSALQALKSAVLHFLSQCEAPFSEAQMLPLALAGSSVGSSDVVHAGEALYKKLKNVDLDAAGLVQRLYDMYLGTAVTDNTVPLERKRRPAPFAMKMKILALLQRSKTAVQAPCVQQALRVIVDTLLVDPAASAAGAAAPAATAAAGSGLTTSSASRMKMQAQGLLFMGWLIHQLQSAPVMHAIAPVLMNTLLKLLASLGKASPAASSDAPSTEQSDAAEDASLREGKSSSGLAVAHLRGEVYQLLGALSLKRPELFNQNLKMLALLFRALQEEQADAVVQQVHDALANLRAAYVGVQSGEGGAGGVAEQLQMLLLQLLSTSPDRRVRLNALQCFNRLFPFQAVLPRYANLLLSTESALEIKDECARGLAPFVLRNELEAAREKAKQKREQERKKEEERKRREEGTSGAVAMEVEDEAKSPEAAEATSPSPVSPTAAAGSSPSPAALPASSSLPLEASKVAYPPFPALVSFAHAHILSAGAVGAEEGLGAAEVAQVAYLKAQVEYPVRALPLLLDTLWNALKQNAFYAMQEQPQQSAAAAGDASAMSDVPATSSSPTAGKEKAMSGLTEAEILSLVSRHAERLLAAEDAANVPPARRALLQFQALIEHALSQRIHDVQASASQHLVRLVSLAPSRFAPVYAARLEWIETQALSGIQHLRSAMGDLLALIAAHLEPNATLLAVLSSFAKHLSDAEKIVGPSRDDVTHGAILALGVLVAEALRRNKAAAEEKKAEVPFPHSLLTPLVLQIARRLDGATFTRTPHITAAAIISLGRIGEVAPLPIPEGEVAASDATTTSAAAAASTASATPAAEASLSTRASLVAQLLSMLRGQERKAERVMEEAIKTLSLLVRGDRSIVLLRQVVEGFFAAQSSKMEEIHFAIGEAMADLARTHQKPLAAAASASVAAPVSLSLAPEEAPKALSPSPAASSTDAISADRDLLATILPRLLNSIAHGSAAQRSSATVWLLCLCKFAWDLPAVPQSFERIQAAFSVALTDSSQFVQEVAAKGMAVLYEHSSGSAQRDLVDSLLRTFSSGTRKVTSDTVIALDEEKGEFSTYRELVDVAKDMQRPDLVYSFMDLAAHHSIWSSKLGAAFSLSSMVSVNAQLAGQLGSILPRLYRYQFDTNAKIRDSMKKMWLTLVPQPREALNAHFDAIMIDLLDSMGNRQFRVRNSACAALGELLGGRGMGQLDPYLERLWLQTFRLLDDVNETVRKSASSLAQSLSQLSLRLCDTVYSTRPAAQKALSIVLPVLLTQGISSKAKEIQSVSIRTILALVKIGGQNLRPHLPTLVGTLLESMASLEPAVLSYYQQHAASIGLSDEQLERARLSMASGGPLAEALSSCLLVVDDDSIPGVIAKLTDIISTGLGLPTLTGAAKFVISLTGSKSAPAMREHVVPLITQLQKGLKDQSPTLRKVYADALGHLCRVAKKKRVEKVLASLHDMYLSDQSNDTSRLVSGFALRSIARQAGDVLRGNFLPECVPVAWLASHDNTPGQGDIAKAWADTLEELLPGLDAAIPGYQRECVVLIQKSLDSPVYALRHIALLALKHLIVACKARFATEVDALLPQLIKLLPGRLWTGKEVALDALLLLGQECASKLSAAHARSMLTAVRAECARNKTDYKREAIRVYGKLVACFPYLSGDETVAPIKEILQPILELTASDSKIAAQASTAGGAAPAASAAAGDKKDGEKEAGPDVLLISYSYACLADLLPKPQAAVNALHSLRVLAGSSSAPAAAGSADATDNDWYVSQSAHAEWLVSSLLRGLEKGFVWTVRVAIWTALKRVVEDLYDGEPLAPTVPGAGTSVPKKSYGASLVTPSLVIRISRAAAGSTGLGEPKFPAVRARCVELLQALVGRPATWAALTTPASQEADATENGREVCKALEAQLRAMRADQDATVLRLAPAIQAKLAATLA